ncbi:hypothetical protein Q3G72_010853 [Acer saccharum]|nr:hypothetical protein Q3G72_010853 [Acer saccharum]
MAKQSLFALEDRLFQAILGIQVSTSKETCLKLSIGYRGQVIDVRWIQKNGSSSYNPEMIRVYISHKREIKVDDKVAERHGTKGIISNILPRQDMPYLQDGRLVVMVFNPNQTVGEQRTKGTDAHFWFIKEQAIFGYVLRADLSFHNLNFLELNTSLSMSHHM